MSRLTQPALGRKASLGDVYDAKTGRIYANQNFSEIPETRAIIKANYKNARTGTSTFENDTISEKFRQLHVPDDLKLQILAETFSMNALGKFLRDERISGKTIFLGLSHRIKTGEKHLNRMDSFVQNAISSGVWQQWNSQNAFVITKIIYGMHVVVTIEDKNENNEEAQDIRKSLDQIRNQFSEILNRKSGEIFQGNILQSRDITFRTYSDLLKSSTSYENHQNVTNYLETLFCTFDQTNNGKGIPVIYEMEPVANFLRQEYPRYHNPYARNIQPLDKTIINNIVGFFEHILEINQTLNDLEEIMSSNQFCIPFEKLEDIRIAKIKLQNFKKKMQIQLIKTIHQAYDQLELKGAFSEFVDELQASQYSKLANFNLDISEYQCLCKKAKMLDVLLHKKVTYCSHKDDLKDIFSSDISSDIFVLKMSLSNYENLSSAQWNIFLTMVNNSRDDLKCKFVLADGDYKDINKCPAKPMISHFNNEKCLCMDIIIDEKLSTHGIHDCPIIKKMTSKASKEKKALTHIPIVKNQNVKMCYKFIHKPYRKENESKLVFLTGLNTESTFLSVSQRWTFKIMTDEKTGTILMNFKDNTFSKQNSIIFQCNSPAIETILQFLKLHSENSTNENIWAVTKRIEAKKKAKDITNIRATISIHDDKDAVQEDASRNDNITKTKGNKFQTSKDILGKYQGIGHPEAKVTKEAETKESLLPSTSDIDHHKKCQNNSAQTLLCENKSMNLPMLDTKSLELIGINSVQSKKDGLQSNDEMLLSNYTKEDKSLYPDEHYIGKGHLSNAVLPDIKNSKTSNIDGSLSQTEQDTITRLGYIQNTEKMTSMKKHYLQVPNEYKLGCGGDNNECPSKSNDITLVSDTITHDTEKNLIKQKLPYKTNSKQNANNTVLAMKMEMEIQLDTFRQNALTMGINDKITSNNFIPNKISPEEHCLKRTPVNSQTSTKNCRGSKLAIKFLSEGNTAKSIESTTKPLENGNNTILPKEGKVTIPCITSSKDEAFNTAKDRPINFKKANRTAKINENIKVDKHIKSPGKDDNVQNVSLHTIEVQVESSLSKRRKYPSAHEKKQAKKRRNQEDTKSTESTKPGTGTIESTDENKDKPCQNNNNGNKPSLPESSKSHPNTKNNYKRFQNSPANTFKNTTFPSKNSQHSSNIVQNQNTDKRTQQWNSQRNFDSEPCKFSLKDSFSGPARSSTFKFEDPNSHKQEPPFSGNNSQHTKSAGRSTWTSRDINAGSGTVQEKITFYDKNIYNTVKLNKSISSTNGNFDGSNSTKLKSSDNVKNTQYTKSDSTPKWPSKDTSVHSNSDKQEPFSINPTSYAPTLRCQPANLQEESISETINILILGETGVGKSTWINGFANYIKYNTLEEAEVNEPTYLIGSSFKLTDDDYNETLIRMGQDTNEKTDLGKSATQMPKSHLVTRGSTNLRLIDTPGIGDTRGIDKDKENFQNILSHLSTFDAVHGICILLKPNTSRMNITFQFCIKELLAHLHKDACKNIVFVFTNSRGTFYKPGDSFPTLRNLLRESKDIDISLGQDTIYCMDNEPVRFLAARKQGMIFNEQDRITYSKSWKVSADETFRLLDYITALTPHSMKATMSINDADRMMQIFGQPIVGIIKEMYGNIVLAKRVKEDISKSLVCKADVSIKTMTHDKTDKLMLVCVNPQCMKRKLDEGKKNDYYNICHKPCGIKRDGSGKTSEAKIRECEKMDIKTGICHICYCSWNNHEYRSYIEESEPIQTTTEQNYNGPIMWLCNIQNHIQNLKMELEHVLHLGAQLATFLKQSTAMVQCDAIAEFFDNYIKFDGSLQALGENVGITDALTQGLHEYLKKVHEMENAMRKGHQVQVQHLNESIDRMYALPIHGKRLKQFFEIHLQRLLILTQNAA